MSPPTIPASAFASAPAKFRLVARYQDWSVEELRGLALQLQVSNAEIKSRRELLELLAGGSRSDGFQNLENRAVVGNPGWR